VIVVDIPGFAAIKEKRSARKTTALVVCVVFAVLALVTAAVSGFYYYVNNSYYLTDEDGKVAVYQGLPGSLFGFRASHLSYVTDVDTASLNPGVAVRLQEGIRVNSLEDAEGYVDEYREDAARATTPGSASSSGASSNNASSANAPSGRTSLQNAPPGGVPSGSDSV